MKLQDVLEAKYATAPSTEFERELLDAYKRVFDNLGKVEDRHNVNFVKIPDEVSFDDAVKFISRFIQREPDKIYRLRDLESANWKYDGRMMSLHKKPGMGHALGISAQRWLTEGVREKLKKLKRKKMQKDLAKMEDPLDDDMMAGHTDNGPKGTQSRHSGV